MDGEPGVLGLLRVQPAAHSWRKSGNLAGPQPPGLYRWDPQDLLTVGEATAITLFGGPSGFTSGGRGCNEKVSRARFLNSRMLHCSGRMLPRPEPWGQDTRQNPVMC